MAFWVQLPFILFATVLVITQVHVPHVKDETSAWEKFTRIDWLGSFVLMVSVRSILFHETIFWYCLCFSFHRSHPFPSPLA